MEGMSISGLKTKSFGPCMSLLKTFDTLAPNHQDILKDSETSKWPKKFLEVVLSILATTDKLIRKLNFTNCQIAAIMEIFYTYFCYLAIFQKINQSELSEHFRQTLLLYTVHDPPECLRIFNAVQSFEVAKLFHEQVLINFDLLKNKMDD